MKLPIWVKHKETGKWHLFPYHLLETFPDGNRGVSYSTRLSCTDDQYWIISRVCRDYFRHDSPIGRLILIEDKINETEKAQEPARTA